MTLPRIHLATGRDIVGLAVGRCGWMGPPARFVDDALRVTCRLCRKAPAELPEIVAELVEEVTARPWSYAVETADEDARREMLKHEATRRALEMDDRERRGVAERCPFSGPVAALRAFDEVRINGASPRSTSDPARFEVAGWTMSSTGGGDAAQRAVERIAPVSRAWEGVLVDGWVISAHPTLVALSAEDARQVVAWAQLGLQGRADVAQLPGTGPQARGPSKAAVGIRVRADGDMVAEHASKLFGVDLPVGHVEALRVRGMAELYRALVLCGQVPRDGRWEMADPLVKPWDYEGWSEIGEAMHMSARRVRKLYEEAKGTASPMPLTLWRGVMHARKAELQAWWDAQLASDAKAAAS